jgi:low-affinity inorganic phosphate transporter
MLHLFAGLDLHTGLLLLLALAFVLFYEAINGFHDTANAVATVIYTRAMRSQLAGLWRRCSTFWVFCWVV